MVLRYGIPSLVTCPRSEQFLQTIEGLNQQEQLSHCTDTFRKASDLWYSSSELILCVWQYIEDNRLLEYARKTPEEYRNELENVCGIGGDLKNVVDIERRRKRSREQIKQYWNGSVESCLEGLLPSNLSRNLLERLAKFARLCPDPSLAKQLLQSQQHDRAFRSRRSGRVIVEDIERAISAFRSSRKSADTGPGSRSRSKRSGQGIASGSNKNSGLRPKKSKIYSAPENALQDLQSERPDLRMDGQRTLGASSGSDLSEQHTPAHDSSGSETNPTDPTEADRVTLEERFPDRQLSMLIDRELREEMVRILEHAMDETRGCHGLTKLYNIIRDAKPARIYVENVPPNTTHGIYITASREEADVLALSDEAARQELSEGRSDGTSIFIRKSKDPRSMTASKFLSYIATYRNYDLDVQDPKQFRDEPSSRKMSALEITGELNDILSGEKMVGYEGHQTPPYNLLPLPSLCSGGPAIISGTEDLRIHQLLRDMNFASGAALENTSWSTLSAHMAATLPRQDHDGFGALVHGMFGYKLWVFWPRAGEDQLKAFLHDGNDFKEKGARYIIIAPGDQYIQTPCVSQDIHAFLSIGYCGFSACHGHCAKSGQEPCCGLIGTDEMHFWHAKYMADSIKSALFSLKHGDTPNQGPHADFEQMLQHLDLLINRRPDMFGCPETIQRLRKACKVRHNSLLTA